MGHHINSRGEFQSDRHPELPPDRIRLNLANPRSVHALRQLAKDYAAHDPEFAQDLDRRLTELHGPAPVAAINEALGLMNSMILCGEDHTDRSREVLRRARDGLLELSGIPLPLRTVLRITDHGEEEVRMLDLRKGDLFRILTKDPRDHLHGAGKVYMATGAGFTTKGIGAVDAVDVKKALDE